MNIFSKSVFGTLVLGLSALSWGQGITSRMSVSTAGVEGNGISNDSQRPAISANGRYIAFSSHASNLAPDDTNGVSDVFVRDRLTGTTTLISRSTLGVIGEWASDNPSISADGRFVAFQSSASNFSTGLDITGPEIFVHDMQTGVTSKVSLATNGDPADFPSVEPQISADGRYVAFRSGGENLDPNDTNTVDDVFVRDRLLNTTVRVSISSTGQQASVACGFPSISADGRYVAFVTSDNGMVVGDTNGTTDVFVRDLQTNTTTRVSTTSADGQANGHSSYPSISADGRYVVFYSSSSNLVAGDTNLFWDVFLKDRQTGVTERVSVGSSSQQGNGYANIGSISADGRYVAFYSSSGNLVANDNNGMEDVYVHDRQTDTTIRVSTSTAGVEGNNHSNWATISADGKMVAFVSAATNLVADDTNGSLDVFVNRFGGVALDSLTVSPGVVTGGTGSTGTVHLVEAADPGGVIVSLSSGNAAVSVPASAFVPEGSVSADFAITTVPISSPTAVTLTATLDAISRTATLTVRAPILTSLTLNPQIQAGSLPSTGRVNLSGPAPAGFVVTLTKNTGLIDIPVSVTVPEGATFATFDIQTQAVTGPVQAQIVARRSSVQRAAILFLYPTTLDSVTISPSTVKGGTATTGTVHLTLPAPAGGANVQLLSLNPAVASVPSVVFVPAGQTSKTFTITTSPVASTTNVSIRANRNGVYRARVVTVTP